MKLSSGKKIGNGMNKDEIGMKGNGSQDMQDEAVETELMFRLIFVVRSVLNVAF